MNNSTINSTTQQLDASTIRRLDASTIILHVCCAVCAAACAERLRSEGEEPLLFFSNSNIAPKAEYDKRLEAARTLASAWDLELVEDIYDHQAWLEAVKGYENEPEKGRRCPVCFDFSFARTAAFARERGISAFTSTLTVSPHKISRMVFAAGGKYPEFRNYDFKKKDGFKRCVILSRELGLYHQHYCGCEFSLRDMNIKKGRSDHGPK
ncbi:MAG: epoxyqueuosine reductase QueH [bacterium]|jgi:predicted adenine nucleotide alpha hydrolase (AANH) superfamily ATPase|nr:epoxyqueuosine reductase QueH [bacterium]